MWAWKMTEKWLEMPRCEWTIFQPIEKAQFESRTLIQMGIPDLTISQDPNMNPIIVPIDGGKDVNILGIPMLIRLKGSDTQGIISAVESHDVPGGGPPPHIHHREDETFQILEGEYEFTVGGESFVVKKGATIFAPRGIPHTYRYLGQTPGRLMCIITPAGFEGFFEEIGAMSPQQQLDIPRVLEIAGKFGMEILPPTG